MCSVNNLICKIKLLEREIGKLYLYVDEQDTIIENMINDISTNEDILFDISSNSKTGVLYQYVNTNSQTDINLDLETILQNNNPFYQNQIITPIKITILIEVETNNDYNLKITLPPLQDEFLGSSIKLIIYNSGNGTRLNDSFIYANKSVQDEKVLNYINGNGESLDELNIENLLFSVFECDAVKFTDNTFCWAISTYDIL